MSDKLYNPTPHAVEMMKPRKAEDEDSGDIFETSESELISWIKSHTLYECDAERNNECEKLSCHLNGGPCRYTLARKYKVDGTKPIVYFNGTFREVDV